jgi:glycogen synthase
MADRIVLYTRAWRSGTGLYAQGLAQGIADAGYPVTFIAPGGEPDDPASRSPGVRRVCPPRERIGPAPRLSRALASLRRVLVGLGAVLRARASARHFVFSIPDPYLFSLPAMALLRLMGGRIVFVCHDPEPHAWILPAPLRGIERLGHALTYWMSETVVVLAQSGRAALGAKFGVAASKIAVIPHGVLPQAYVGPAPGRRTLLLFGTIRRNKQVDAAIRAVADLHQRGQAVRLVVAGGADPADADYVETCRALAARWPDAIDLQVGYVSDEATQRLLAESDAMLLPYAGFDSQSGVAVLAGLAGRPVIATAAGGIADLMDSGLAGVRIAEPADDKAIGEAIEAFFGASPAAWTARAVEARARLLQTLNWRSIGEAFGALFDRSPALSGAGRVRR